MDTLLNIRTFLAAVKCGSFSAAAAELGVMPSVVTKRIRQLEHEVRQSLFTRSTRRVALTEAGERLLPKLKAFLGEYHEILETQAVEGTLTGRLRIKAPMIVGRAWISDVVSRFMQQHPHVTCELILTDRSVNPIEEGFDIAVSIWPGTFKDVVEIPLIEYPRMLVASPGYLKRFKAPSKPADLNDHQCLSLISTGNVWSFSSEQGAINIEIVPRISVNDVTSLLKFAIDGHGIALVSELAALPLVRAGLLTACLDQTPPTAFEVTARIPQARLSFVNVQKFIQALKRTRPPVQDVLPVLGLDTVAEGRTKAGQRAATRKRSR
jgi:DNA-binding transcriptional LysR family regulator